MNSLTNSATVKTFSVTNYSDIDSSFLQVHFSMAVLGRKNYIKKKNWVGGFLFKFFCTEKQFIRTE